ncbi:ABC transporter permease [Planotetraspora kaengkrachanensis]|uniref:Transport permease protein n=1 Tax=Planotetraspora kaengkrachanensis TaxID=575193 RepID=A0A8J3PU79_9ACTN|nr:ABC transporter permease [Planotetraspora kaengkrachanensis]GIG81151.1 transport permease protein [Planotetraspora kaengkrachanensis]
MTAIIRTPGLGRLAAVESRLFLREPLAVFFAIGLPAALLLILGSAIPGFRDASPELGGLRPVDAQLPGMMVLLSVATLALSTLPTALVVYRERGVLRRMSTTPVQPVVLLAVQLAINAVVAVVATTLTLVSGHLVLDMPFPRALLGFTVVVVLGAVAMFALGLFLAAVAPNSRIVQGVGAGTLFPLLFFAGMWLPRDLMPEALRRVSDFTPTGAFGQGLVGTLGGHTPSALHLAVMAGWAVVAVIAATRTFRWQ